MLLVVSTNPSLDRTLEVPDLVVGRVHRATGVWLGAGGKGLNVVRAARILDQPVLATGYLAGHTGALVADVAASEGLPVEWHLLPTGETRTCLLINHAQGDSTVINEPGPDLEPSQWEAFAGRVLDLARRARAVAFAGSVPPSVPSDAYGDLCRQVARRTDLACVDSSTRHLDSVVREPGGLVIKVNRRELSAALGRPLEEPGRLLAECRALVGAGARAVVVTLGRQGALGASPDGAWRVRGPEVPLGSSVGSGDSFLAGFVAAILRGAPFPEALRLGAACGAANAATRLPARFPAEAVVEILPACRIEPL